MSTQLVEVPGMGPVEFPASMSDADISAAIKKNLNPEKGGTLKDVGKSVLSAIPKAAAGIVGLPQTVISLPGAAAEKLNMPTAASYWSELFSAPNIGDISRRGFDKMGVIYEPKTTAGKFAGAATEGATSGAPFGILGAASGLAGGIGGEAAGQATNNSPYARFFGALLTGGLTGLLGSARSSTGTVLKDTLQGTTDDQFKAAQNLINEARARGIALTGPEALAQVKNSAMAPELGLQRVVEQSRGGGQQMSGVMSQRPDQNRQAFQGVLGQIGPRVQDPTSIAPRVQGAAEGVIDDARQAGNTAARPFYAAAEATPVPASTWNNIASNPVMADALAKVKSNPMLGLQYEKEGSVRWLDAAKKYLDEAASPGPMAPALDRAGAANAGRASAALRSSVDAVSPDYAKARGIVEKNLTDVVDPLKRQPVGQLAGAMEHHPKPPTFQAQRQVLFPVNPETLTPQAVRTTISQLRMKDPTAARDLTRQFLETQFDEVTQSLVKGGNEFGGAKFAAAITGNSKQAQNIRAAVESVGGKDALTGFNKFIQIMEAQGKRQPAGSATEFNKQITEQMSGGGLGNIVTKPLSTAGDWWERFKYAGNSKELAQVFTDPQSVAKMRKLSMLGKDSPGARALATSIVVPLTQAQE